MPDPVLVKQVPLLFKLILSLGKSEIPAATQFVLHFLIR